MKFYTKVPLEKPNHILFMCEDFFIPLPFQAMRLQLFTAFNYKSKIVKLSHQSFNSLQEISMKYTASKGLCLQQ